MEPLMVTSHNLTVNQFCAAVPCGRTKTYELIADGEIEAVKLGKKTLIPRAELERLQARLPRMRPRTGSREEQTGTTSRLLKVSSTSDECRHDNGDNQRPGPPRGVALSSYRHVATAVGTSIDNSDGPLLKPPAEERGDP
jgi:excisionase family DNA binding protein